MNEVQMYNKIQREFCLYLDNSPADRTYKVHAVRGDKNGKRQCIRAHNDKIWLGKNIIEILKKFPGNKGCRILYGEYDIIAEIQTADIQKLNSFLLEKLRPIKDIENASALIAVA